MASLGRFGGVVALAVAGTSACQMIGGFKDFQEGPAGSSGGGAGGQASGGASSGGGGAHAGGAGASTAGSGGASGGATSGGAGGGAGSGGAAGSTGGAAGSTGGAAGGAACPNEPDPGKRGPPMAQLKRPNGTCFWIDTTEVTVTQYLQFLAAPPPAQIPVCSWNIAGGSGAGGTPGFSPPASCVQTVKGGIALDGGAAGDIPIPSDSPMTCVDWCDALAFCTWAGKDLCRDDGNSINVAAQSDWYGACTAGGSVYGCAKGCTLTACNGASSGNNTIEPVGSLPNCAVPSANGAKKIYDLSGNVSEWTNWCSPTTADGSCTVRGGGYESDQIQCDGAPTSPRKATLPSLGFRCCAELRGTDSGVP